MKILRLPELRQSYDYDCGANALESIFQYYGLDIREDIIIKEAKTKKPGTPPEGIINSIKKHGLKCRSGEFTLEQLKKFIDRKIPVILLIQAWTDQKKVNWKKDWKDGHYVVAVGYDKKKIYFDDPCSVFTAYLTYDELEKRWHDIDTKRKKYIHFGIAVYGKKPVFNLKKKIHMD